MSSISRCNRGSSIMPPTSNSSMIAFSTLLETDRRPESPSEDQSSSYSLSSSESGEAGESHITGELGGAGGAGGAS